MLNKFCAFISLFVICLTAQYAFASAQYEVVVLGTLGGNADIATDINNSLVVTGYSKDTNGNWRGFIWDEENGMVNISGSNVFYPVGISEDNVVAGYNNTRAIKWSKSTGYVELTTAYSGAYGVSDNNEIVGHRGGLSPTYWNSSGGAHTLSYSGRRMSIAYDLIDSNHIIGITYDLSNGGTGSQINVLPIYWSSISSSCSFFQLFNGGLQANAKDINSLYNTVGWATDSLGVSHAVLWETFGSTPIDLGEGIAKKINSSGDIILGTDSSNNPVMWIKNVSGIWSDPININDLMTNLPDGYVVSSVNGINDNDYFAGTINNGSSTQAVYFAPVSTVIPEPASVLLVALALLNLFRRSLKSNM